jgi:hypothetical protein
MGMLSFDLSVDTAQMGRLAGRIRAAAAEARAVSRRPGALRAGIQALATPCLTQAAAAFVDTWASVMGDVVDDAERLADAIDAVLRLYQDVEWANARGLRP